MVKKNTLQICVWKFTEKDLERWETKLLTVFKPMVTEGEEDKGGLLLVTLYILQLRFSYKHVLLLPKWIITSKKYK